MENFGTKVTYRLAGVASSVQERVFEGAGHGEAALKFCLRAVAGLTQEQYDGLKASDKAKLVQRNVTSPSNPEAVSLWMRIKPVWDWHSIEPVQLATTA